MILIIFSILVFLCGGILSWIVRVPRVQVVIGAGSAVMASILPLVTVGRILYSGIPTGISFLWSFPGGVVSLHADPLAALFLLPLLIVSCTIAIYGIGYLKAEENPGYIWFLYNALVASMILVVVAANGVLFLLAWETMSLVSLLLVIHEHTRQEVPKAGWIYFVATHIGTAFLIPLFLGLADTGSGFEYSAIGLHSVHGMSATVLFFCAVLGFGCKAGFVPFHVWLPEAHPAAPSHISALMSGVMIKMGIYGLLRICTFLESPPLFWGMILTGIGLLSGLSGILFAIAQRDVKRLLAYSSIENMGIIAAGMGIGMIGVAAGEHFVAIAGFSGALLHVVNHAFFKSLLFMGVGAVVHGTGIRDMERLGGLLKKMPAVAVSVILGGAAICGLPPLNGFISEFLIFTAGMNGITSRSHGTMISSVSVIAGLAGMGGLAVAAFSKLIGTVFLGEPRDSTIVVHKPDTTMLVPLFAHVAVCGILAAGFVYLLPIMASPLHIITAIDQVEILPVLFSIRQPLFAITAVSALILSTLFCVLLLRFVLLSRHRTATAVTWDCGYMFPTSRMQYTGSSFVQPIVRFFSKVLKPQYTISLQQAYFPRSGQFSNGVYDIFLRHIFGPLFSGTAQAFSKLRWLQGGTMHVYVLYIALAVISALIVTFAL